MYLVVFRTLVKTYYVGIFYTHYNLDASTIENKNRSLGESYDDPKMTVNLALVLFPDEYIHLEQLRARILCAHRHANSCSEVL